MTSTAPTTSLPGATQSDDTDSDLAIQPDEAELNALRELQSSLEASLPEGLVLAGGDTTPLPQSAVSALRLAIEYLARNLAIVIEPYTTLLTTQRAADLLKASRPYVVGLLDDGVIPHTQTRGGHRRVRFSDVIAYQNQLRQSASAEAAVDADPEVEVEAMLRSEVGSSAPTTEVEAARSDAPSRATTT